jgi:hypothetical protein
VIRVYDAASNVIETHEHKGDLKGTVLEKSWQFVKTIRCERESRLQFQKRRQPFHA